MNKTWTAADILALGVRTDVETAGSIFGLSRTQAYEAVNGDRLPVPTFRIGRRVAPLLTDDDRARLVAEIVNAAGVPTPELAARIRAVLPLSAPEAGKLLAVT
jgi:hypothetical protein